jgi:hypothetical protein
VLSIQPLTISLPPHSSSFSKCVEGKVYNEKIQFAQTIIHDINKTRTYAIEFLRKTRRH